MLLFAVLLFDLVLNFINIVYKYKIIFNAMFPPLNWNWYMMAFWFFLICYLFPSACSIYILGSSLDIKGSEAFSVPLFRQLNGIAEFLNCLNQLTITSTLQRGIQVFFSSSYLNPWSQAKLLFLWPLKTPLLQEAFKLCTGIRLMNYMHVYAALGENSQTFF